MALELCVIWRTQIDLYIALYDSNRAIDNLIIHA